MKKLIYLIVLSLIIIIDISAKPSDEEYRLQIVGAWNRSIDKNNIQIDGVYVFQKDDTFSLKGVITMLDNKTPFIVSGIWKVKNGFMIMTIKNTNIPKLLPVGSVTKDQVINVDEKTYKFKTESGAEAVAKKHKKQK